MQIIKTQQVSLAKTIAMLANSRSNDDDVMEAIKPIVEAVAADGDKALFRLTEKFDRVKLATLEVPSQEIDQAWQSVPKELTAALKKAKKNIEKFHNAIVTEKSTAIETTKGVLVWREFRAIEKVGLYVPGGTAAYFSTVLMLAIPAKAAGCQEIIMCTPAGSDGRCNAGVLVAADMCGIKKIYKIGGAQAIAAMAYGTASIPKVDKIFGPGNQYVATAKTYLQAFGKVAIDMPAGPSEVMVIADESANPKWLAADLLSQLEHGEDSQAVLICFSENFAAQVIKEMEEQTKTLSRRSIVEASFKASFAIVVKSINEACTLANAYAPEHLEIVFKDKKKETAILKNIQNVGSVFLGPYSSEPLGDYATGSNHTLPTSGYARMYPPLSTESFGKYIQVQEVTKAGIQKLKKTVEILSSAEGLDAHGRAVTIRFEK